MYSGNNTYNLVVACLFLIVICLKTRAQSMVAYVDFAPVTHDDGDLIVETYVRAYVKD
jgi:hypothetical protein